LIKREAKRTKCRILAAEIHCSGWCRGRNTQKEKKTTGSTASTAVSATKQMLSKYKG
jgi:hypothetical protein